MDDVTNEPLSVPVRDEASVWLVDPSWEIPMVERTVETRLRAVGAVEGPVSDPRNRIRSRTEPGSTAEGRVAGASRGRLLVTFDEAAEMLGIGRTSLYRLVWAGRLTPVRIGRSVRFSCAQLAVFVSSLESGGLLKPFEGSATALGRAPSVIGVSSSSAAS
jgi:excisionase family DNA binding protein